MAARLKSRFNLLLLDEGEYLLDEYAGVLFHFFPGNTPDGAPTLALNFKQRGRIRICTRGIFFEPDDPKIPVVKLPYRHMPGKPLPLQSWPLHSAAPDVQHTVSSEGVNPKDAVVVQACQLIEMKAMGMVGPYKAEIFEDTPPVTAAPTTTDRRKGPGAGRGAEAKAVRQEYPHILTRQTFVLATLHISGVQMFALLQQLWQVQHTCLCNPSAQEQALVEPIIGPRRDGAFALGLLGDYRERPLLPASPLAINVERIFPMVTCPGRLMLTEKALYLQPIALNNVAGTDPVTKWSLRDIKRVMRRTRLQRNTGLELILHESSIMAAGMTSMEVLAAGLKPDSLSSSTVFFSFQSVEERDVVYREILTALRERATHGKSASGAAEEGDVFQEYDNELGDIHPDIIAMTTRNWQLKKVSNLEYLEFLNLVAGRSYADITQYPVMPWVIKDYTSKTLKLDDPNTFRDLSKPIGALNAARLANVKGRLEEMPEGPDGTPPFLYGTHYSTPAYVLYYLVRSMPEQMLRLQSGRFDAPDRLFFEMASTWSGVTSMNMDVKELIPEFYKSDGSFLMIPDGLDLGVRQNGKRVGHVGLPPWAYDAGDFIQQCRAALESDYVSSHLHHWIDLIFGFKQRGEAAKEADNLFYYLTYDGAVDIDNIADPGQRTALQQQIAEFGQTPKQLFTEPHPSRSGPVIEVSEAVMAAGKAVVNSSNPSPAASPPAPAATPTPTAEIRPASTKTPKADLFGDAWNVPRVRPVDAKWFSMRWTNAALRSDTPATPHEDSVSCLIAYVDKSENAEGGVEESIQLISSSRGGRVRALQVQLELSATIAEYGTVFDACIHPRCDFTLQRTSISSMLSPFLTLFSTVYPPAAPAPVSATALTDDRQFVFCGCWDGSVHLVNISTGQSVANVSAHTAPISSLALHRFDTRIDGCSYLVIMSSLDSRVSVWLAWEVFGAVRTMTLHGSPVAIISDHTAPVTCASVTNVGNGLLYVASGNSLGHCFWHAIRINTTDAGETTILTDVLGAAVDISPDIPLAKADPLSGALAGVTDIRWCPVQAPQFMICSTVDGSIVLLECTRTTTEKGNSSALVVCGYISTGSVIRSVAVDATGTCAATAGNDNSIKLWSLAALFDEKDYSATTNKDSEAREAVVLTSEESLIASLTQADENITYGNCSALYKPEPLSSQSRASIRIDAEAEAALLAAHEDHYTVVRVLYTNECAVVLAGSKTGKVTLWTGTVDNTTEQQHDVDFGLSVSRHRS